MKQLLLFCLFSFALINCFSQTTVTGKITDEKTGAAISGATIKTKQGRAVAVSGTDGSFTLNIPGTQKTLIISFVGYSDKEVEVSKNFMNISLSQSSKSLSEVVV
ncbi:MAG TPA: carboxypeptidase-like regulatory domain-containing protein, partial [Chitinophagaceae bacterium]